MKIITCCIFCGEEIKKFKKYKNFCSARCYRKYKLGIKYEIKNCPICGKQFDTKTSRTNKKACCTKHSAMLWNQTHKKRYKEAIKDWRLKNIKWVKRKQRIWYKKNKKRLNKNNKNWYQKNKNRWKIYRPKWDNSSKGKLHRKLIYINKWLDKRTDRQKLYLYKYLLKRLAKKQKLKLYDYFTNRLKKYQKEFPRWNKLKKK